MSLDVRLVLALPDYETPQGKKDLLRLFMLGNPTPVPNTPRVQRLSAESVYTQQAQLDVRGKIREICAKFNSFNEAFKAFGAEGESNFGSRVEHAVAQALADNGVPLRLVHAVVSNMKPDQSVIDAIAARRAAEERLEAIKTVTTFLDQDSSGARRLVYQMQTWQEIVNKANTNGHNTIMMTDIGQGGGRVLPLPPQGQTH